MLWGVQGACNAVRPSSRAGWERIGAMEREMVPTFRRDWDTVETARSLGFSERDKFRVEVLIVMILFLTFIITPILFTIKVFISYYMWCR